MDRGSAPRVDAFDEIALVLQQVHQQVLVVPQSSLEREESDDSWIMGVY